MKMEHLDIWVESLSVLSSQTMTDSKKVKRLHGAGREILSWDESGTVGIKRG